MTLATGSMGVTVYKSHKTLFNFSFELSRLNLTFTVGQGEFLRCRSQYETEAKMSLVSDQILPPPSASFMHKNKQATAWHFQGRKNIKLIYLTFTSKNNIIVFLSFTRIFIAPPPKS